MGLLTGLRVVEGSAFVAAPLGGLTLAQLGADVIRFDAIGGGIDYHRWPVTDEGVSLYWAGLNKGKRSIAVDTRKPEGQELITALITAPGTGNGIFLTNFPASGWLGYEALKKRRRDLIDPARAKPASGRRPGRRSRQNPWAPRSPPVRCWRTGNHVSTCSCRWCRSSPAPTRWG